MNWWLSFLGCIVKNRSKLRQVFVWNWWKPARVSCSQWHAKSCKASKNCGKIAVGESNKFTSLQQNLFSLSTEPISLTAFAGWALHKHAVLSNKFDQSSSEKDPYIITITTCRPPAPRPPPNSAFDFTIGLSFPSLPEAISWTNTCTLDEQTSQQASLLKKSCISNGINRYFNSPCQWFPFTLCLFCLRLSSSPNRSAPMRIHPWLTFFCLTDFCYGLMGWMFPMAG